ncbi:O-methyltransferase [Rhizobium leguminosarum]|uniref:O-methyltransferase n=1 Tax=Rhizobium leguminosarum TaxID=384 RepID=UPI0004825C1E|nr:O-methyltransferase [Rhizobium leguminosarum]
MSKGASLPYRLRPNKAVDRELFLGLLSRLAASLDLEDYRYVGLGGPFLEDFRLLHARLGINDLVSVEVEESVHLRQHFNRPIDRIECVHSTLEDYIDGTDFEKPVIIWFDYTVPSEITEQIERFARTVVEVPLNSILRITLNANPESLGKPEPGEIAVELSGVKSSAQKTLQEWRLDRLRERLGGLFPSDLKPEEMTRKRYGSCLLKTLHIAVEKEVLNFTDRRAAWVLATHYADGQPMVTATLIVAPKDNTSIEPLLEKWEYNSSPEVPLVVDMPALSTLERLTMESCDNPQEKLGFDLPRSDMGEDPYLSFKRFYRFFPHFSRIEL